MMDRLYKIVLGLVVCLSFAACNDDEENTVSFSLDKSEVLLGAEGGADVVLVESNDSWTVSVSEPWLTVSPASGVGNAACTFVVDSSLVSGMRTATVRFVPATQPPVFVDVKQMGYGVVIVPENSDIQVEYSANKDKRYFETTVTTNVKFTVEIDHFGADKWLIKESDLIELDKGARPRTAKLRFNWERNTVPEERFAEIKLIPIIKDSTLLESGVEPAVIRVKQKAGLKIEDSRAGDSTVLIVMYERMNCMSDIWDTSENMQYWRGVELWEAGDKDLPNPAAVGRVRAVQYSFPRTTESVPSEVRHLKYLESLAISGNVNSMLLDIKLGDEICELEHLKYLTLYSYGLVSLPDSFVNLGDSLVALDLGFNNFTEIPEILTPGNFPKLKSLSLLGSRRKNVEKMDLRNKYKDEKDGVGIGLHIDASTNNAFRRLLLWENLEELSFSNCYIEGQIPDFTVGEEGVTAYTEKDIKAWGGDPVNGDTIAYLLGKPKILPNCTMLRLNLNFLTGKLPDWLLYHPHLIDWVPEILIFNQQEQGLDSEGRHVRFDNVPETFDYYYDAFPGTRAKYEIQEEITEE